MNDQNFIQFNLLGGSDIFDANGRDLQFATRKSRALMILLAMSPGFRRSREQVAAMLWSRSAEEQARASLRQTLSELRKLLGTESDLLLVQGDNLALNPQWGRVDVHSLQACAPSTDPDDLEKIADIYRGDFLEGFSIRDNAFEDWALVERRNLRDMAINAMSRLLRYFRDTANPDKGIPLADKILAIDPLHEFAHHALMLFYAAQDRRGDAVRQYELFRGSLHRELGIKPPDETEQLYQLLIKGEEPTETEPGQKQITPHGQFSDIGGEVRYCQARDGTNLAYMMMGDPAKPPLIMTGNWLTHLQEDLQSPVWRPLIEELIEHFYLIRYDQRGMGLSDWEVTNYDLDTLVDDLSDVVGVTGCSEVSLFGICQAGAISACYAARQPERVGKLVIVSSLARGWRNRSVMLDQQADAMVRITLQGWQAENPAFRQIFSSLLIPDSTIEQLHSMNELQRVASSPENAARVQQVMGCVDLRDTLPRVTQPTLVIHPQNDPFIPLKEGKKLAAGIPNARLLTLPGSNHIFLSHETAWNTYIRETESFLLAD